MIVVVVIIHALLLSCPKPGAVRLSFPFPAFQASTAAAPSSSTLAPSSLSSRKRRKEVERAVSRLIAILDELDTDPEAEPCLGAPEASVIVPQWARGSADREQDDEHGGDVLDQGEEDLGWAANVSQVALGANTADGDLTAPERHGMGFVRLRGGRRGGRPYRRIGSDALRG